MAAKARDELNARLPGGAGGTIDALVLSWKEPSYERDDLAAAAIGQVKAVGSIFYNRLIEVGYTDAYPWTATTTDDADDVLALIGQVKHVFRFDITKDTDGDRLPDWREAAIGTNPLIPDTNGDGIGDGDSIRFGVSPTDTDIDDDGLTNATERSQGTNPFLTDTDDDEIPDGIDTYPLDPLRTGPDVNLPGPPMIAITKPSGAVLIP